MSNLKYTVVKTKKQYNEYCNILNDLDSAENINRETEDEIELLTLLIENYDAAHNSLGELAPIPLLKELMAERKLKATDLVDVLEISKGYVSDILNLRKGLSKDVIRKLAAYFHLHQEAFNRPYPLVVPEVRAEKVLRRKAIRPQRLKLKRPSKSASLQRATNTAKPGKVTRSTKKAKALKITKQAKTRSSQKKVVPA